MLRERQEAIQKALADGGALVSPDNAIAVGRYREIEDLFQMKYDDLLEEKE